MKPIKFSAEQLTQYVLDTDKNKEMIDKIIKSDGPDRLEFEKYLDVWEKSAKLSEYQEIDTQEDWIKVRKRMGFDQKSKTIPFRSYFLRIAAILIFAAGLAVFFARILHTSSNANTQYFELASGAEIRTVELPDGSTVTLNKNSKIIRTNHFGGANRDIILEGQAFFEVARNEKLPFKVHTLNSVVEVLGTKFDIRADSNLITVGVVSGKVAFYENENTNNRVELTTNNTGVFHADNKRIDYLNSFDPNSLTWRTKKFVFHNEPLQNVCKVLANHYQLQLETDDQVEFLDSINITCNSQSLDQVLGMINSFVVEDIKLVHTDNKLIVRKQ